MPKTTNQTALNLVEIRAFGRRQTQWHGWIEARSRARTACIIRNISEGGALLECSTAAVIPNDFRLVIEHLNVVVSCDSRHRSGHHIGVEFRKRLDHPAVMCDNRPVAKPKDGALVGDGRTH